mmetsp:Transcript_28875/g.64107  ORF Transcript_28875/g.64107 Transcript_28875/m.64107 type:complete len:510 (-) Transcript_28875:1125-2654(-)
MASEEQYDEQATEAQAVVAALYPDASQDTDKEHYDDGPEDGSNGEYYTEDQDDNDDEVDAPGDISSRSIAPELVDETVMDAELVLANPDLVPSRRCNLSRRDKVNLVISLIIIAVVIVGVAVPVVLIQGEKAEETESSVPTPSPTSSRVWEYDAIRDQIVADTGTSKDVFDDPSSPQSRALDWIVFVDPARLTPESANLIQRYALMTLYYGSDASEDVLDWEAGAKDECTWAGIGCHDDAKTVKSIELEDLNLAGTLVSEIGLLSQLSSLVLSENKMEGSLPASISFLVNLKDLYLHNNFFTGPLLDYAVKMPMLEELDACCNSFSGTIPLDISSLMALRVLGLHQNRFSGPLPTKIGTLSALEFLVLNDNVFDGTIVSQLGQLRNLTYLSMGTSGFEGQIPSELGLLSKLQVLDLSRQPLTGTLPRELGNMTSIEHITMIENGLRGTIPSELGRCANLKSLELFQNNLRGEVSDSICDLRADPYSLEVLAVDCVNEVSCPPGCCTFCF